MTAASTDRRRFLQVAGGTALASPLLKGRLRGANDRLRIGFIGVGRMGSDNIRYAARVPGVEIAAVCDVNQPALETAEAQAKKLGFDGVQAVKDFRRVLADKSIDAVSIATPDHWHAYMTIEACRAGKDVWVEKPACVYVEEGLKMVEAARRYKRVVQGGTIERSGGVLRQAREMVRSGRLGEITFCNAFQTGPEKKEGWGDQGWGNPPDGNPPPGLDWELWLGPAPRRPFNPNRWGVAKDRWDYAGGAMTGWGVDLLDVLQFAFDEAMPIGISAQGGRIYATDNTETPDTMMATFRYPGFIGCYERRTANPYPGSGLTHGTTFHGTEATLLVNREGCRLFPNASGAGPETWQDEAMVSSNMAHWRNFVECVRTRAKPVSDIETVVRSTMTCLLANIALRMGVSLEWDDAHSTVRQGEAQAHLRAHYRAPWKLEV